MNKKEMEQAKRNFEKAIDENIIEIGNFFTKEIKGKNRAELITFLATIETIINELKKEAKLKKEEKWLLKSLKEYIKAITRIELKKRDDKNEGKFNKRRNWNNRRSFKLLWGRLLYGKRRQVAKNNQQPHNKNTNNWFRTKTKTKIKGDE